MSTYLSGVTSWAIRSMGKSGARSSGPIGSWVPGWRGGGGGSGRSGTRLYQAWGISDSSNSTFVTSAITASSLGLVGPKGTSAASHPPFREEFRGGSPQRSSQTGCGYQLDAGPGVEQFLHPEQGDRRVVVAEHLPVHDTQLLQVFAVPGNVGGVDLEPDDRFDWEPGVF